MLFKAIAAAILVIISGEAGQSRPHRAHHRHRTPRYHGHHGHRSPRLERRRRSLLREVFGTELLDEGPGAGAKVTPAPSDPVQWPSPGKDYLDGLQDPAKRHPTVRRELSRMAGRIERLGVRRGSAEAGRASMADSLQDAQVHMGDATHIQRDIARTELKQQKEEKSLEALKDGDIKIAEKRRNLLKRLHAIIDPRLRVRAKRRQDAEQALKHQSGVVLLVGKEQNETKSIAIEQLKARGMAEKTRDQAEKEVEQAKIARDKAQKEYEWARHQASVSVEAYRFVQAKYAGERDKETEAAAKVKRQTEAAMRIQHILNLEQARIDKASAWEEARLQKRRAKESADIEAEAARLVVLKKSLKRWQDEERQRAEVVVGDERRYQAAQDSFDTERQDMMGKAVQRAGRRAESSSDWAWESDWSHADHNGVESVHLLD